jgi:hypothetical protein
MSVCPAESLMKRSQAGRVNDLVTMPMSRCSARMWLWAWTDPPAPFYVADMNANEKIRARYRAREAQVKANEKRYRRDRANVDDAATIRVMLHRVGAVDTWERTRLDQAAEHIRADAAKRRASYYSGLQAAVDQMRDRGQTLAKIAALVEVDVREIQAALRRARTADNGGHGSTANSSAGSRPTRSATQDASTDSREPMSDSADRRSRNGARNGDGAYDPTRCVRCDAVMLDAQNAPRRGRRRLYCSDTCRRDASAARTAAERHGSPIRVVEVPKTVASLEQTAESAVSETSAPVMPLDAVDITLENDEALHALLARVTEQARLKKLDRATLTAARELAKAVHPLRTW